MFPGRPDRYAPIFGALCYNPAKEREGPIPFEEIAGAMKALIDAVSLHPKP